MNLIVESCPVCDQRWYLHRTACPSCGGRTVQHTPSDGRGRAAAVTVIHQAPREGHPPTPFAICLVDLDEGVRVMCRSQPGLAIGDTVAVSVCDGIAWAASSPVLPLEMR